ncbi:hypothetical protein FQA47_004243 [Oryzias melastigma]|uniref:Uncharacterized protein n=1 Tax=Oryzias melastigma TaxID=30732 RepID=A0A834FEN5_ORYME|nr:hypothetical protein FQA47_004243 [Oryzias melastigma]
MAGKKLQPSAAPLGSAQLRSVKPQIIHSLSYETEEEGEAEGGGDDRKMWSSTRTPAWTNCHFSILSAARHSPHSSATENFSPLFSLRSSSVSPEKSGSRAC